MRLVMLKTVVMLGLVAALSACVEGPAQVDAGLNTGPSPEVTSSIYGARADGGFTVPQIPVEKVPPQFQRQTVAYETDQPVGTVIINPSARYLYLVTGQNKATRFGIAVGRAGFEWAGEAVVNERKSWPTWTPPPEMIDRKPELAKFEKGQPGGLTNPLGARAMYLTTNGVDYGYRIHGTPEWDSIGTNASSGCIRMINQDVMDLVNLVPDGAKVVVLNADGSYPKGLKLPPHQPTKKKAVAAAAPVPAVIVVPMPSVMPTPVITGPTPVAAPVAAVVPATAAVVKPAPVVCAVALVNGVCPAP